MIRTPFFTVKIQSSNRPPGNLPFGVAIGIGIEA